MTQALHFEEATHTYTVGGIVVPSVTTIIKAAWPELYRHSSDFARERGSIVHEALHLHILGRLDVSSVCDAARPYYEAGVRFLEETGFEVVDTERRVYSPTYGYAGTLDLFGVLKGIDTLADFKTGDPGWQAGPQLAAYQQAYYEETKRLPKRRVAVWLKGDGTYRIEPYTDFRNDFADFTAALRVYARREREAA